MMLATQDERLMNNNRFEATKSVTPINKTLLTIGQTSKLSPMSTSADNEPSRHGIQSHSSHPRRSDMMKWRASVMTRATRPLSSNAANKKKIDSWTTKWSMSSPVAIKKSVTSNESNKTIV